MISKFYSNQVSGITLRDGSGSCYINSDINRSSLTSHSFEIILLWCSCTLRRALQAVRSSPFLSIVGLLWLTLLAQGEL